MLTLTRGEAEDAISDAMSDVHDMDTTMRDFAKAALKCLEADGLVFAREPDAPCAHCGAPATTSQCRFGGCPIGADL